MEGLMTRLELEAADLERREAAASSVETAMAKREEELAEGKRRLSAREDRFDLLQERLEVRNAELIRLMGEAEHVLRDRGSVAQERSSLEECGKALLERESKLRESWDACARAALLGKDASMERVLYCDVEALRRDAKFAEDLAIASPAARCPGCARHETRLQRWAIARELDADALLSEAHKERELIREFEVELECKWARLAELALELEGRWETVTTGVE